MLRGLSVCLSVVLVGMFFFYLILFSYVIDHLDEPVEMLSFPPSIFGSWILDLFAATFVIHVLAS